jgi:hypothetical protein
MLTDSYDVEELRRHLEGDRAEDADAPAGAPPMDATAPIPLDLSDWGDASPPANSARDRTA